ncbi:MAG: winged helix-turn-helix domain-containing protein [Candidatus Muirbacterium halophilum]|nr:winged helix-turn-helix domain-containing protein [Candidatus Muirbacterium halophilum]MCK9475300.1 winged helix-turn-helix domain-containing protein [Candidatus Muirbacterium halophilum]
MYNIGEISGAIWKYLSENGKVQYKKMRDDVMSSFDTLPMKDNKFSMAIGWLAKEGKLNFIEEGEGRRYRLFIELR